MAGGFSFSTNPPAMTSSSSPSPFSFASSSSSSSSSSTSSPFSLSTNPNPSFGFTTPSTAAFGTSSSANTSPFGGSTLFGTSTASTTTTTTTTTPSLFGSGSVFGTPSSGTTTTNNNNNNTLPKFSLNSNSPFSSSTPATTTANTGISFSSTAFGTTSSAPSFPAFGVPTSSSIVTATTTATTNATNVSSGPGFSLFNVSTAATTVTSSAAPIFSRSTASTSAVPSFSFSTSLTFGSSAIPAASSFSFTNVTASSGLQSSLSLSSGLKTGSTAGTTTANVSAASTPAFSAFVVTSSASTTASTPAFSAFGVTSSASTTASTPAFSAFGVTSSAATATKTPAFTAFGVTSSAATNTTSTQAFTVFGVTSSASTTTALTPAGSMPSFTSPTTTAATSMGTNSSFLGFQTSAKTSDSLTPASHPQSTAATSFLGTPASATTSTITATTAQTSSALVVSSSSGTTTSVSAPVASAPKLPSEITGKTVEEIIKEWNAELQERTGKFRKQANAIADWDKRILHNRDVLLKLEAEVAKVVETQSNLERQLELIETHQQEVDKSLQSVEEEAERIYKDEHAQTSAGHSSSSQQEVVSVVHGNEPRLPHPPHSEAGSVEIRESLSQLPTFFISLESRSLVDMILKARLGDVVGTSREMLDLIHSRGLLGNPTLANIKPAFDVGSLILEDNEGQYKRLRDTAVSQSPMNEGLTGNLCDPGVVTSVTPPIQGSEPVSRPLERSPGCEAINSGLSTAGETPSQGTAGNLGRVMMASGHTSVSSDSVHVQTTHESDIPSPQLLQEQINLIMGLHEVFMKQRRDNLGKAIDTSFPIKKKRPVIPFHERLHLAPPKTHVPKSRTPITPTQRTQTPSRITKTIPKTRKTTQPTTSDLSNMRMSELSDLLYALLLSEESKLDVYDKRVLQALTIRKQYHDSEQEIKTLKDELVKQKKDTEEKLDALTKRVQELETTCRPAAVSSSHRDDPDSKDHPEGGNAGEGQGNQ